jgi:glycolate oxidase FAD binding subunit
MTEILKPENTEQVMETIKWAVARKSPLEIRAGGSKQGIGRPMMDNFQLLDLTALSGISYYEPEELVLSASAATPMADIHAALSEKNQQLAFEPPDFSDVLGSTSNVATLGGTLACNLGGPRRIQAGAARDHFLGFKAISGRGEEFKSGGRVVKNVTGFDLSKLIAGSHGTLAVVTEATVKVLPVPEKMRTVLIRWAQENIDDHGGIRAMTDAMASAHEVSGAAHLPATLAKRSTIDLVSKAETAITALRVEGPALSVNHRCLKLRQLLGQYGATEELHSKNSKIFWSEVRDLHHFTHDRDRHIWRISVPPSEGSKMALKILEGAGGEALYDWAGGLVWLALDPTEGAHAESVRYFVTEVGGYATLFRAPDNIRRVISVFQPLKGSLANISKRIKEGFDPSGVLNPGRMYEGA